MMRKQNHVMLLRVQVLCFRREITLPLYNLNRPPVEQSEQIALISIRCKQSEEMNL